jgi:hypothetical protein
VYVELFAKTLRKLQTADDHGASATVQLSETLPATDDLWLTDGAGNRYVAELRVVAVDLLGPVPG